MRRRLYIGLIGLVLLLYAFGQAQEAPATPQLIVKELLPHPVGAPVDVEVALLGNEDRPLSNNVLELYLDGEYLRRIRTSEDGTAKARISRDLAIGSYNVSVKFIGTKAYLGAETSLPLVVRPATLQIQTVPPLANIKFALEDRVFNSDQNGVAQIELFDSGNYQLKLLLEPDSIHTHDTKLTFARWNDAVFTPERTVEFTHRDLSYQIGFELSHPVETTFIDLGDETVDWSRVESLTLKSSAAAYRTITQAEQPYWLQANRIMRQKVGIFPTPLLWSVESVMLDGSNVVNRYQQRFYVEPNAVWEVRLLLYQARIRSRDAFFGFSVGTGVAVTYPDGDAEELVFNEENEVSLINMARGLYKLQVLGATGVAPVTPVAMTKDQEVVLKVLSGFDIGALVFAGLSLAFGLLFFGRPHLIGLRRRPLMLSAFSALSDTGYGRSLLGNKTDTLQQQPFVIGAEGQTPGGIEQAEAAPTQKLSTQPDQDLIAPLIREASPSSIHESGLLHLAFKDGKPVLKPFVPAQAYPPITSKVPRSSTREGRALIDGLIQDACSIDWQVPEPVSFVTEASTAHDVSATPSGDTSSLEVEPTQPRILRWLERYIGLKRLEDTPKNTSNRGSDEPPMLLR